MREKSNKKSPSRAGEGDAKALHNSSSFIPYKEYHKPLKAIALGGV